MSQTRTSQKICVIIAFLSYLAAVGCIAAVAYFTNTLGKEHPYVASFGAAVVFFVGAGIVLHVIGRTNLPDLTIRQDQKQDSSES